jgi:hypothetical protein
MFPYSDIGAFIKSVKMHVPVAVSGSSAVNATGINRIGHASLALIACTGAATGTPTSFSFEVKVQDSADDSSYADYKPDGTNVAATTITAVNTLTELNVDLRGARKYVRVVVTPTFVGGTSPTVLFSSAVALGGSQKLPTA